MNTVVGVFQARYAESVAGSELKAEKLHLDFLRRKSAFDKTLVAARCLQSRAKAYLQLLAIKEDV